jgi:hypothetical protein
MFALAMLRIRNRILVHATEAIKKKTVLSESIIGGWMATSSEMFFLVVLGTEIESFW